jgi:positive control factor
VEVSQISGQQTQINAMRRGSRAGFAEGVQRTRRLLKRAYEARREGEKVLDNQTITERQLLSEMIGDVEYVIEWLETGRCPGNRRGIERRAAYQRERLMDTVRMQAFVARSTAGSPANLTEWERQQNEDALCVLSDRERECYVLTYGECFSHAEIANLLGITKISVDTHQSA